MEQLILIHGALGNSLEFDAITPYLTDKYTIITYEIPGHGKRSNELQYFTLNEIITDFTLFLKETGPAYIFGFSLGGYLALCTALESETNIKGIITLGTKLNWSPEIAQKETATLSTEFLQEKAPPFYNYLVKLHHNHLSPLLSATANFMTELGNKPVLSEERVNKLTIPVHMLRGGKDRMVTAEETLAIANAIPNGKYFEVPSFPHPLGFIKPKMVATTLQVQLKALSYQYLTTQNFGTIAFQAIKVTENKQQPTLLFLHEALGSIAQWKSFPEKLCNALNLNGIVIELNGYGFSDPNPTKRDESYLHDMAWKQLPEIIATLPSSEPFLLVGHSDGGTNALLYSHEYTNNVIGLVTMAAHVINEPETKAGILPAIEAYQTGKLNGLECYHGNKTEKLFYDWADTWLSEGFNQWNIQGNISAINKPVLAIQGDLDQYGTALQLELIEKNVPNVTTILLDNCGHSPHIEQTEEVIKHIKLWKEKLL